VCGSDAPNSPCSRYSASARSSCCCWSWGRRCCWGAARGGAGLLSAGLTYTIINKWFGGLNFPIAFFSTFLIPVNAVWWGLAVGGLASLVGSIVPAWSAQRVKVSEVFSKIA